MKPTYDLTSIRQSPRGFHAVQDTSKRWLFVGCFNQLDVIDLEGKVRVTSYDESMFSPPLPCTTFRLTSLLFTADNSVLFTVLLCNADYRYLLSSSDLS